MDRFIKQVEEARAHLADPMWDEARARNVLGRLHARRERKPLRHRILVAALVPVAAMVVLWFSFPRKAAPPTDTLVLHDGSRAQRLTAASRLSLVQDSAQSALLNLDEGRGRFEVVPNKARRFRVTVGGFSVEALGTVFVVEKVSHTQVHVAVVVGHVAVQWPGGRDELWQGQERLYPTPVAAAPAPVAQAPAVAPTPNPPSVHTPMMHTSSPPKDWRQLAKQKAFARAFVAMRAAGAHPVRDLPDELMLAADVSRRAGHPEIAAQHLDRIVQAHAKDPRSYVAAFTLGRVQTQRGLSREAAVAFERAFALQPKGALAEDALAKAAFAWKAVGDTNRVRLAVDSYMRAFPQGRQNEDLKRLIQLP